jgi:hypothetical protein
MLKKGTLGFAKIDKKEFEEQSKKPVKEKVIETPIKQEIKNESMDVDDWNDEDTETLQSVKLETNGKSLKRSSDSIQSESDDERETKKENKKSTLTGKVRKRVRVMEDSSDEEVAAPEPESKTKKSNVLTSSLKSKMNEEKKEITKVINEEETYVDEDGYLVTRQVKKSVKSIETFETPKALKVESPDAKMNPTTSPEETKKDTKKAVKTASAANNKKGQPSILSFFKPKN